MRSATPRAGTQPVLLDAQGLPVASLRIAVTERCGFHCSYCRAATEPRPDEAGQGLGLAELQRLAGRFVALGVSRIRLSGGEPLLREDLAGLIAGLVALPGVEQVSVSTNGDLLAERAEALRAAGLQRVNLSLDSLDADCFTRITRGGELARVLRGLQQAARLGFESLALNMVVMRAVNEAEIGPMIDFAAGHGLQLRLIETLPMGVQGSLAMGLHLPAGEIRRRVADWPGGDSPSVVVLDAGARRRRFEGSAELRLDAQGQLLSPLGPHASLPLARMLAEGADDAALDAAIVALVNRRTVGQAASGG